MEYLNVRTKGNANPQGRPRVYFTCHPEDFERAFGKVCGDIFKTHDCAVYYKRDMSAEVPEENRDIDLDRMNLFVIPVTFKLLTESNPAMDSEFQYAKERHIAILPILLEPGLEPLYSRRDKFGDLQYLDPYSHDATAVSYEEKLKKYLDSVLISNETAEKIRAAFDAYIFLSYRKKDRKYANELMRLIHSNPLCRDIAIWYDEFLTPGENFNDAIDKALQKSELFTLLVTPNLINEENYVRSVEYPAAQNAGKEILPAEVEATDPKELRKQFEGIPECVNVKDENEFRERLLTTVSRLALRENDADPAHNFLIGLAYLDGIDVEVDRARAVELITGTAEAELPEAMKKLQNMYHDGVGVERDYREALKWHSRAADFYLKEYGEGHPDTFTTLCTLASSYQELGDYQKAIELHDKTYRIALQIAGEDGPGKLILLTILTRNAAACDAMGDHKTAILVLEQIYELQREGQGEAHLSTLEALDYLALAYSHSGDYEHARRLQEKSCLLRCKTYGAEHPQTLVALSNLAITYGKLGDIKRKLEIQENIYQLQCKIQGEDHIITLITLSNLAGAYRELKNFQKARELYEKAYQLRCKVLGEEHPETLIALSNLAFAYSELGDHKKALPLKEKVYSLRCKVLGEEHPQTITAMNNLMVIYDKLGAAYGKSGETKKELELQEKLYPLRCKALGEEHSDTLTTLLKLAFLHYKLGDNQKAFESWKKLYQLRCKLLGEEHRDTLTALHYLAAIYHNLGDDQKAIESIEQVYRLSCKAQGSTAWFTLIVFSNMAKIYHEAGYTERALEICSQIAQTDAELTESIIKKVAKIYEQTGHADKASALRRRLP